MSYITITLLLLMLSLMFLMLQHASSDQMLHIIIQDEKNLVEHRCHVAKGLDL